MLTDDERKILNDYLVKSFETASDLNLFLVETVWPRYRVSRIPALKVHPHYVTLGGVPIPLRDIVQLARERAVVRDTRSGACL